MSRRLELSCSGNCLSFGCSRCLRELANCRGSGTGCGRGSVFGLEGLCCKLRKNSISANRLYSLGTGPSPLNFILTLTSSPCRLDMVHEASSCFRHPHHIPCSFSVAHASSLCPMWLQYGPGCCRLPPVATSCLCTRDTSLTIQAKDI